MSDAENRSTAQRTLVVIGLALAVVVGLALMWATRRVLIWVVLAAFFAVCLNPLVDRLQRRLVRRRAAATLVVFLATFVALAALGALIVVPLVSELGRFADQAPGLLREARAGRGPIGALLERFHVRRYVEGHADDLQRVGGQLGRSSLRLVRGTVQGAAGALSTVALAFLMVVQARQLTAGMLALAGDAQRERLRRVGRESAGAITGYVSGNLLISVICGSLTFLVLVLTGVPFAAVIALLVAIADLIPMVGATLGAIVAGGAGFLHSPTAGVVVLVFFVVYQQVENHVLQPVIMSRSVQLNPLAVLISVLIAAELGGIVAALLAIPAAGIVRILWREFVPAARRAESASAQAEPADQTGRRGSHPPAGQRQEMRTDGRRPGTPVTRNRAPGGH
ncbi:MAG TPA: AI-2E family transporter [Jiangellales bacterium]|nr:AI-2E family transporter [Jiangellales bacterium]